MPRIRNFSWNDLAQLTALMQATSGGSIISSLRPGARACLGHPNLWPEEDIFVADEARSLAGYAIVHRELEIGRTVLGGAALPQRCEPSGRLLLEAAIAHSRALGARHTDLPIRSEARQTRRLAAALGFRPARYYWEMRVETDAFEELELPGRLTVRPFSPSDDGALAAIQNLCFVGTWGYRPNTVEDIAYQTSPDCLGPEGILFLADEEEMVAYCWLTLDPEEGSNDGPVGRIFMIGVHPSHRGRGLGRAIALTGISYLRRRGIREVKLSMDSRNAAARRLYQGLGLHRQAVIIWYQRQLREPGSSRLA